MFANSLTFFPSKGGSNFPWMWVSWVTGFELAECRKYCHTTAKARRLKVTQHPPGTQSLSVFPISLPYPHAFRALSSHSRRTPTLKPPCGRDRVERPPRGRESCLRSASDSPPAVWFFPAQTPIVWVGNASRWTLSAILERPQAEGTASWSPDNCTMWWLLH